MSQIGVEGALQAGESWMDARRYDQALAAAGQALAADPNNAAAHVLAGRALLAMERYPEAVDVARHAIAQAPQWSFPYRVLSIAVRKSPGGDSPFAQDQVLSAAAQAVRLAPADPANHANLAEACVEAGQLEAADEAIRRAIALDPASASTWASASFVAIRAKNWIAAEKAARRALALEPDNYTATNNLGVAMRARGRWTHGAVAFHGAARIDPRRPVARENVEAIGFHYLSLLSVVLLLPLLFVWPVFVAARLAVTSWLVRSRPERLRPVARRIGLRIATSKRTRRRFEREHERAQRWLTRPADEWSALKGRQRVGSPILLALLVLTALIAFTTLAATFSPSSVGVTALLATITAALAVCAGLMLRTLVRRRWDL